MNDKLKHIATGVCLLSAVAVIGGCNNRYWISGPFEETLEWDDDADASIAGLDSAMLARYEWKFRDGSRLPVILWTDCHIHAGRFFPYSHEQGPSEAEECGDIEWDSDANTKCSYRIHVRRNGRRTIEIDGSEYDLDNGTTMLFRNHDGKVDFKQIAGLPSDVKFDKDSLMKYAHENQEIVEFYSDKQ